MTLETPDLIYMNGRVIPWQDANVHVWTEVVLRAASAFEGIRGYWRADEKRHYFVYLPQHYARLGRSTKLAQLPFLMSYDEFLAAIRELTCALNFKEDVYLRPTVYLQSGRYTTDPSELASGFFMPMFPAKRSETIERGISCAITSWRRVSDQAMPARAKVAANYFNLRLGRLEAEAGGFDEAIFLNESGRVAETGGASVFIVRDGVAVTPSLTESILDSITRDSAIRLLERRGLRVEQRPVARPEVYIADEAFLTGTLAEITPIVRIDQQILNGGQRGEITAQLQQDYYRLVISEIETAGEHVTPGPVLS